MAPGNHQRVPGPSSSGRTTRSTQATPAPGRDAGAPDGLRRLCLALLRAAHGAQLQTVDPPGRRGHPPGALDPILRVALHRHDHRRGRRPLQGRQGPAGVAQVGEQLDTMPIIEALKDMDNKEIQALFDDQEQSNLYTQELNALLKEEL